MMTNLDMKNSPVYDWFPSLRIDFAEYFKIVKRFLHLLYILGIEKEASDCISDIFIIVTVLLETVIVRKNMHNWVKLNG